MLGQNVNAPQWRGLGFQGCDQSSEILDEGLRVIAIGLGVAGVDINHPPRQLAREGACPVRIALNMGIAMLVQMAFLLFAFLGVMIFVALDEVTGEKQSRLAFKQIRVVRAVQGSEEPFPLEISAGTNQQIRRRQRGYRRGGNVDMIWVFQRANSGEYFDLIPTDLLNQGIPFGKTRKNLHIRMG